MRLLLIDNYDSFTFNLMHLVAGLGPRVEVVRNDALTVEEISARSYDGIVISPGPATPNEAGVCLEVIAQLGPSTPVFGVCLGMQAIGQALGGHVVRAPTPMHGKVSRIEHGGRGVFRGINGPFEATRYHSLVIRRADCPTVLDVTAETADGLIMGVSHRSAPLHGVQFHPESIASEHGATMVKNFLDLAAEWNKTKRPKPV